MMGNSKRKYPASHKPVTVYEWHNDLYDEVFHESREIRVWTDGFSNIYTGTFVTDGDVCWVEFDDGTVRDWDLFVWMWEYAEGDEDVADIEIKKCRDGNVKMVVDGCTTYHADIETALAELVRMDEDGKL